MPEEKKESKNEVDLLEDRLEEISDRLDCEFMVIREVGPSPDKMEEDSEEEDFEEDEEKSVDSAKLTRKDVDDSFRCVFMPKARDDACNDMEKLVLGQQYGASMVMFDTRFSYEILQHFETFKLMFKKLKKPASKLDLLFGFTWQLFQYDVWMHDNEIGFVEEFGGGKMVKALASFWKRLLKNHSAEELGLDDGFSYDGVICLLEDFKREIEYVETCDETPFKFSFQ